MEEKPHFNLESSASSPPEEGAEFEHIPSIVDQSEMTLQYKRELEYEALTQALRRNYKEKGNISTEKYEKQQAELAQAYPIAERWVSQELTEETLRHQHETCEEILQNAYLIDLYNDGSGETKIGYHYNGQAFPFPTFEEVRTRVMEQSEWSCRKIEQGFTQLLIVPNGIPIGDFMQAY